MLKELFQEQKKHIEHFFDHIDLVATEKLVQAMLNCSGVVIFSGIGKSGLVGKKIAVTMTSTGTKSLYLSPGNALHGDIGIVSNKDLFIFLSKSGESDELLNLIPFLRNRGVQIGALISDPKSRLAQSCDYPVLLPLARELCPFGLAPTTSSAIQLIFGDILAVAIMRHKNFQMDQYRLNHPAGRIGRRMILKVKDLMLTSKEIPFCRPNDKLVDVLVELSNKRCGCLLVVDEQHRLLGIFTDGDLRRALLKYGPDALHLFVEKLMTMEPRFTLPDTLAYEAMQKMEENQNKPITVLPVLQEGKVLGLIKLHDILQSGI